MKVVEKDAFLNEYEKAVNSLTEKQIKKHGRLPQGFGGDLSFNFGIVVVDDNLQELLQRNPEYSKEIKQIFASFKMDNWGEASEQVNKQNRKLKYLGNAAGMIAVYGTPKGFVRVDTITFRAKGEQQFCTVLSFGKNKKDIYAENDAWNYLINEDIAKNATKTAMNYLKTEKVK